LVFEKVKAQNATSSQSSAPLYVSYATNL
jgi:hypothetical protein